MFSTLTGDWVGEGDLDAGYWYENLRRPVGFAAAVSTLAEEGHSLFIEVSPHPVLTVGVEETVEAVGGQARVTGTLRRDQGSLEQVFTALAQVFVTGVPVDWAAVIPGGGDTAGQAGDGRVGVVDLPTYAFQRQRYWLEATAGPADTTGLGLAPLQHPLLGAVVSLAEGGQAFTGRLSLQSHPWLADHQVLGTVLVPGTVFVEMVSCVAREVGCEGIDELTLEAPLVVPDGGGVQIQVLVGEAGEGGRREVSVHSRVEAAGAVVADVVWRRHARGVVGAVGWSGPVAGMEWMGGSWPPAGAEPCDVAGLYDRLAGQGYEYGPAFQGVGAAWRRGEEMYAEVSLPEGMDAGGYGLHPALLDAVFQTLLVGVMAGGQEGGAAVRLPFSLAGVGFAGAGAGRVRVGLFPAGADEVAVYVADEHGGTIARVRSLTVRAVTPEQLAAFRAVGRTCFIRWNGFR